MDVEADLQVGLARTAPLRVPLLKFEQREHPDLAELVGQFIPGGKDRVTLQAADLLCWYTRNAAHLNTVDRRRYADIAERGGIKSRASEQWINDIVERAKLGGLTDHDSDDDGLIAEL